MIAPILIARFIVWLALWLLTLYLVFLGGGWAGIYSAEIRAVSVVLIAVVLGVWSLAAIRERKWLPQSAIAPALVAALGVFVLGTLLSRSPRLGLEYLAYSILLAGLYLLLVRLLADGWFRERFMGIVVGVAALNGVAYVLEVTIAWRDWWELVGRVTTPPLRPGFGALLLGNPSAVMTVQVLLSTVSLAWLGWSSRGRLVASAILAALAVFATVLSGSRSGWLALAAATGLFAAVWLTGPDRRRSLSSRLRSRGGIALAGGATIAAAVGAISLAPGVLLRAGFGGETLRLANYAAAIRMFADAPILGTGPGTWVAQRIAYTAPSEPDFYVPYAHNLALQTLAEFGLLGAAAAVLAALFTGRLVVTGTRDGDVVRRRMGWAALFVTFYFVGHQMLDFYASAPVALFAFAVPIAYLDATTPVRSKSRQAVPVRSAALMAGVLAAAVSIGGLLVSESVAAPMSRAVALADEGRWDEALPLAESGAGRDPAMPAYQLIIGVIASHAGRPDLALAGYQAAAQADGLPASWLGTADGLARAGRAAEATLALAEALRVGRQQPAILVAAGDLYLRLGDHRTAVESFAAAVVATPSLGADRRWTEDPRLAPLTDEVMAAASSRLAGVGAVELALARGDFPLAEQLVRQLVEPSRSTLELVIRGWQGDASALMGLVDRAQAEPLQLEGLLWAARLAAHQGDEVTAARLRSWAETVNGLSSVASYELRFAAADIMPTRVAGLAGRFYGHYTYRRPTPSDQIPAGLLQLEIE